MNSTCRRATAIVLLLIGLTSITALAAPNFTDENVAAGNLNPTDEIRVMEIRVRGDTSRDTTLTSVTVQNTGTATHAQIDRIRVLDGGAELGDSTNLAGLSTGVTINLGGYTVAQGTTHDIRIRVTIGGTVSGGETVNLRVKFHYQMGSTSYTSAWISDRTGETIRDGGFDTIISNEVATQYLNPLDDGIVQVAVFSDLDANGNDVKWVQTGSNVIVRVENLGTATTTDIDEIRVTLRIGGVDYTTGWVNWAPASPMPIDFDDFAGLPLAVPDNGSATVTVEMLIEDRGDVTDNRTIRTKTTLHVKEGAAGNEVAYDQNATSKTTVTIRKQGFEEISEDSGQVASGTLATGEMLLQTVTVKDVDSNGSNIRATQIEIQNLGSATGAELASIEVKSGGTQLAYEDTAAVLADFGAGIILNLAAVAASLVNDDGELELNIYYELATPTDGHTLKPQVRVRGNEPNGGANQYWSDAVAFPSTITLYEAGLEVLENLTPPEGGTIYSGQRAEVQRIYGMDIDENTAAVSMHPFVIKNLGTARENPDVVKIEITRSDTETGTELPMGETTDLSGFRTGGVRIDTFANNQITDKSGGSEVWIHVYVTLAEPEEMVAGRTLQLETRVLHTESLVSYDKAIVGNPWTLETNHRPVPEFTYEKVEQTAAASIRPMQFTTTDTIQFTATATDPDGDAIDAWHWNFGDGNTSNLRNPTHQYAAGGTYTVTLTVTDERGVTGTVSEQIEVEGPPNEPPTIDELTADPEEPAVDQDVEFAATVTDPDQPAGTAFDYEWDFGDGTTSTVANPTHSFAAEGTYTVTLTITDAGGDTDTATIEIIVGNDPPTIGGLTATPTAPGPGDTVTLTATNVTDPDGDAIDRYEWDFGDGETAETTEGNTTHVYTTSDTFTVEVVAVDARGARSAAKTVDVTVTGPARAVLFAFPNPAETEATFTYFLPDGATDPILRVYDLLGRLVLEQELPEGETAFVWDLRTAGGGGLPNGLYFCVVTVTGANRSEVFRLLIVR